eukprot:360339-Chlamydomonas_euryale.AAC.5
MAPQSLGSRPTTMQPCILLVGGRHCPMQHGQGSCGASLARILIRATRTPSCAPAPASTSPSTPCSPLSPPAYATAPAFPRIRSSTALTPGSPGPMWTPQPAFTFANISMFIAAEEAFR